ncbi:hypothetical protein [Arthrobacter sp. H20]|uniref:hypothetical protein n=1 Tax=Arthrobacter sp. H20 TaxID=1267981 RepID=UPI0004B0E7C2|nr:hypothetical protein [Arthrobacter sp. H20]
MPDRSRQGWLVILDTLEEDIAAAEKAQHDDGVTKAGHWDPPSGIGPIPSDLVDRAQRIREAQRRTVAMLQAAVKDNRQHHALIGAVNASTAPNRAVYLDVAG